MRTLRALVALLVLLVALPVAAQTNQASVQGDLPSLNSCVVLPVQGMGTGSVQLTGTFTGTVSFTVSNNGTNYTAVNMTPPNSTTAVTSSTSTGLWSGAVAGYRYFRACMTSYTSGAANAVLSASLSGGGGGGGGSASSVSITQGGNTAAVNASSQLSVTCANCSGTGVSANEDAAFVDGNAVTPAGTVRQDTLTTDTSLTGDVSVLKSDSVGRLYTTGTGGTFPVSGTAAADAAVSGNPVYIAGRASAAAPTDVSADGDVVPAWMLRSGAQVIQQAFAGVLATTGNGASGTGVQRVTIANDSTGVLATVSTVTSLSQFGGNAINLGAGAVGTGTLRITQASDSPEITALQLIDNPVGSLSGGAAGTSSFAAGGVYNSTPPTLTTGQQASLQLTSDGSLKVSGATGTTQYAEDAVHASGDSMVFVGAIRRDTTPSSSAGTAGDYSAMNVDANGRLYVNATLYNSSGTELTSGDVTEDAAETAGGTGPMVLSVRRDAAASSAGSTGDNATFNTDANGLLWTRQLDPCTAIRPTTLPISAAADAAIITASASNRTYICGGLIAAQGTGETISLWEGTGTACGTGSAALVGSTTEANGVALAANGGFTIPSTIPGLSTNVDVCLRLSGTNRVSGYLTYVQAP